MIAKHGKKAVGAWVNLWERVPSPSRSARDGEGAKKPLRQGIIGFLARARFSGGQLFIRMKWKHSPKRQFAFAVFLRYFTC
jgi:hypothetical protein